jgi:hypothetical protein
MKNTFFYFIGAVLLLTALGCERDEAELQPASYPTTPEVFIDGFSAGLNYAAFGGSVPTAFDVDNEVTYNNSLASMKFEVPDVNDPRGAYAGGTFFTEVGRNLSGYNALTFWAKATQAANIDVVGFGNDLGASEYQVSISGLAVNTNWKKYYIPLPDPSKLTNERGMFFYSEGPENDRGYTFWIDEVKFEKLGTIAHPQFAILNGEDQMETSFVGVNKSIAGLSSIFNLPDGTNQVVNITPTYFEFASSNQAIATVSSTGLVSVVGGPGTATITATVGSVPVRGSLTIQSVGNFQPAPTPTRPASRVISIFSDAYVNVPVNYYNGYWQPWQTTVSNDFTVNGNNVLNYTIFNFVGIEFSSPTVNANAMTHLHMDVFIPGPVAPGRELRIIVVDFGPDGAFQGGDDTRHSTRFTAPTLVSGSWISIDIPFANMPDLTRRANLAQIILEGGDGGSIYVDNIYFYN